MTPILILDQAGQNVKSEVFGKVIVEVESRFEIDCSWLQIEQLTIHTFSGFNHILNIHDWETACFQEYDGKWYGNLELKVSYSFDAKQDDALYAANCSICELYSVIDEVVTNDGALKANNFSIDWQYVYTE